ncbi:hypothetical protein CCACVL1_03043 [Corchorus capsularis]|uniref:Uncharacterized protein n=1 Tax=Corchorus capsularis TaxID=210143 RepID=A0A1R3K3H9_COCAP|nr:hypothetical protein CCACVL1_03043 [Corchorus capsularis]
MTTDITARQPLKTASHRPTDIDQ